MTIRPTLHRPRISVLVVSKFTFAIRAGGTPCQWRTISRCRLATGSSSRERPLVSILDDIAAGEWPSPSTNRHFCQWYCQCDSRPPHPPSSPPPVLDSTSPRQHPNGTVEEVRGSPRSSLLPVAPVLAGQAPTRTARRDTNRSTAGTTVVCDRPGWRGQCPRMSLL